jgi:hypothetical protein
MWLKAEGSLSVMEATRDDEWVALYQQGLSTTKIGKSYEVSASTVRRHILGKTRLRDRLESCIQASTKYPKTPYTGDELFGAYLRGFIEDCHVRKSGRLIEVATTTTHPAMQELFQSLFQCYGHVTCRPGFEGLHSYYHNHLDTYLDISFERVLVKSSELPAAIPSDSLSPVLASYLAGLLDAEGTVRLYNNHGHADAMLFITINKYRLLAALRRILGGHLYWHERAWRLVFYGTEAVNLLERLPLKHQEKVAKGEVVSLMKGKPWSQAERPWSDLVREIKADVMRYKDDTRLEYMRIHGGRHPKDVRMEE